MTSTLKAAISKRLREFTEDEGVPLDHLAIPEAGVSLSTRVTMRIIGQLELALRQLDVERYYGESELWESLERLIQLIRSKLAEAERRS